jgi:sulfofructose kinase
VGRIADDDVGHTIRKGLESEGVDISELAVAPGRSPRSSVIVDTGSGTRAIAAFLGDLPELELSPRGIELCRGAAWVHVDQTGYRAGRGAGRLSVDAGNPIDGLDLSSVTLFGPTESQLARLYPRATLRDAMTEVLSSGVKIVVVTRGARGSVAATSEGSFVAAEAPPVDVRSTLGAGDVFHGALLAALVDGASLDDALGRANTVAALSCRGLDGRSAIPTAAELEEVLERP